MTWQFLVVGLHNSWKKITYLVNVNALTETSGSKQEHEENGVYSYLLASLEYYVVLTVMVINSM